MHAHSDEAVPSDTEAGLLYLCSLFPREKFEEKLPAIVMKHQLYSVIHNKTTADRELVRKCILWLLRLIITPLFSSSLSLLPSLLPFLPSPLPLPPPSMPYYLLILPSSPSLSFSPQFSHPLSSLPFHFPLCSFPR